MLKFAVIFVIPALLCEASVIKDSCSTSGVKDGVCVNLDACPSISAMSTDLETPMTIDRLKYLIESRCGYENKHVKVCCPVEEIVVIKTDQTTDLVQTTESEDRKEETTTSDEIRNEELTTSSEIRREEVTTSTQIGKEETTTSDEIRNEEFTTSSQVRKEEVTTSSQIGIEEVTNSSTNSSQIGEETTTSVQTEEETISSNEIR